MATARLSDLATSGVDNIRATLHRREQLCIEHVLSLGVQRAVNRHHVADLAAIAIADMANTSAGDGNNMASASEP